MGDDSPRLRRHHRILRLLGIVVAVLLVLVVIAGGVGVWNVVRSFPQTSGTIDMAGLDKPVTVLRDDAGIPQITAATADDLFRAQGFVHAQDRFWEMDFRRHVTAGRLAEMFGESQVPTDTFIRTLGWRNVAEQEVKVLDKTSLRYYQDYADGVNAYLSTHKGAELSLEYAVLGIQNPGYSPEPWTPADSVAWLKAMAWDLRSNLEDEIDRALLTTKLTPEQIAQLHPDYPYGEHPTITSAGGGNPSATRPDAAPTSASADTRARPRRARPRRRGARRHPEPLPRVRRRPQRSGHLPRRPARAARARRKRHRLQLVGRLGRPDGDRQTDARQRPAPRCGDAVGLVSGRPPLSDSDPRLPVRRRRIQLLRAARRHHRPQRPDRLGVHEPRPRRRRPVRGEGQRRHLRVRRPAAAR